MAELEVFDGTRLVEIATCHHPINALPRTLTGLGKLFLGIAQLRAQSKLFELEAQQIKNDREYKIALVSAQRDLGRATLELRRREVAAQFAAAARADALRALELRARDAGLERNHREKLLLIEDSYRLARVVLQQREDEVRQRVNQSREALAATRDATRGVRDALGVATALMGRLGQTVVQEQSSQETVVQLASHLSNLGTAATVSLGRLLDASSRSADLAFKGLYEVRS